MKVIAHRRLLLFAFVASFLSIASYLLLWRGTGWKIISKDDLDDRSRVQTPETWSRKKPAKSDTTLETEYPPIIDNFPRAVGAHSAADLPPIPSWNKPLGRPRPADTPLFIGFTRNWRLLQQCVVSYIAAGWPPSQIFVVENTGNMLSNRNGQLSLQNPFFLNHTRLEMLGVNVIITPTLLSFAQLQNFFLWTALSRNLTVYFWAHMDTVVLSYENDYEGSSSHPTNEDFDSLYDKAVNALIDVTSPNAESGKVDSWGLVFFAYDALTLVNIDAYVAVGGWDTHIPFYTTDCDFHFRLEHSGYPTLRKSAGHIIDAGDSLDDIEVLFRQKGGPSPSIDNVPGWSAILSAERKAELHGKAERSLQYKDVAVNNSSEAHSPGTSKEGLLASSSTEDDSINSPRFTLLFETIDKIRQLKAPKHSKLSRLRWQRQQSGGQDEPFYRDPIGFQKGLDLLVEAGASIFDEKWGHRGCDLLEVGREPKDAWQVGHDKTWPKDERD